MGCLNVSIKAVPLHNVHVNLENRNDLSVSIDKIGGLSVMTENHNTGIDIGVSGKNKRLNITVALVCKISVSDKYRYFYVSDGAFVVENGYLMVSKK